MRLFRESLPTHGAGAYHSITLGSSRYNGGCLRLSIGGYGWQWRRPRGFSEDVPVFNVLGVSLTQFHLIASHLSFGPVTLSVVYGRHLRALNLALTLAHDRLADKLLGAFCPIGIGTRHRSRDPLGCLPCARDVAVILTGNDLDRWEEFPGDDY